MKINTSWYLAWAERQKSLAGVTRLREFQFSKYFSDIYGQVFR